MVRDANNVTYIHDAYMVASPALSGPASYLAPPLSAHAYVSVPASPPRAVPAPPGRPPHSVRIVTRYARGGRRPLTLEIHNK